MSYFADHLAWQQRVAQEVKASSQFMERQSDFQMTQGFPASVGGIDMFSYNTLNSGHRTQNDFRRSFNNQPQHPFSQTIQPGQGMNEPGSVPAFNGGNAVITKKDMLRERSLNATSAGKQGLVGVKQGLNPYSYMPRSKQAQKRSNTIGKFSNTLTASMAQQQKQQQQQQQYANEIARFNENNLETLSVKKSQGPRSIISAAAVHQKQASRSINNASRPGTTQGKALNQTHQSGFHKQKILEAVEKMSEKDLEKVSKILKAENDGKNQQDFNNEDLSQAHLDELNDRVDDLQENNYDAQKEDKDETLSRASRGSRFSAIPKSEISRLSNKTYIQHLQSELDEEKEARQKLERELEELKRLSSEISTHLGLNKK